MASVRSVSLGDLASQFVVQHRKGVYIAFMEISSESGSRKAPERPVNLILCMALARGRRRILQVASSNTSPQRHNIITRSSSYHRSLPFGGCHFLPFRGRRQLCYFLQVGLGYIFNAVTLRNSQAMEAILQAAIDKAIGILTQVCKDQVDNYYFDLFRKVQRVL